MNNPMSSPETYCEASPIVGPAGQDIYKAFRQSPYLSNKHSSYFMRRDYFDPQRRIIGMELNPDALRWHELGFEIHTDSQSDPAFIESMRPNRNTATATIPSKLLNRSSPSRSTEPPAYLAKRASRSKLQRLQKFFR